MSETPVGSSTPPKRAVSTAVARKAAVASSPLIPFHRCERSDRSVVAEVRVMVISQVLWSFVVDQKRWEAWLQTVRAMPIAISALTGVMLMLLTGCIKWYDASRALSAPVILIIVTSLAMGNAMVATGGADMIAGAFVFLSTGASPTLVLAALLAMMALLTNVVSNNAAAVIGTPIAISIAYQLGQPPEPFVLAVIFGANMSFATPMAYQTNLLVMNAGNYRFSDFVRVGLPLIVLMWLVLSLLLPSLYGI